MLRVENPGSVTNNFGRHPEARAHETEVAFSFIRAHDLPSMKAHPVLLPIVISLLHSSAVAETVKDREGAVREDRAAMEKDARWIYNDFSRGLAEAKRTGKPLLVVLRCVPCLACAGIDASVLTEPKLAPLLEQFVCVRMINANALDLSLFQFDYDLSFATLFFNGDGTVYGRYGSWRHQKDPQDKTTAGYQRALEAALAAHRGYPGNRASLAGKQGRPMPFKTAVDIPELAGKFKTELDWKGRVVPSCVHCHQIGEAVRAAIREKNEPMPLDLIYPWPAPETIGLVLAPDQVARVQSVVPGSAAASAGLQAGDEFASLDGQLLLSIADVSWVLHHGPESGSLTAVVKRGGVERPLNLLLPADWRRKTDISRRVGAWSMRGMAAGGLWLEDLADEERARRNLGTTGMALRVKHAGEYGKHAAAKKAGFQKEDIIVALDGRSARITESEMLGSLLQTHRPGEKVNATVLRGAQRMDFSLPMQ